MTESLEDLICEVAELQQDRRERLAQALADNPDILLKLWNEGVRLGLIDRPDINEKLARLGLIEPPDIYEQLSAEISHEEGIEITPEILRGHMI